MPGSDHPEKNHLPHFQSEKEEAEFWDTHEVADFLDELEEDTEPIIDARPKRQARSGLKQVQ